LKVENGKLKVIFQFSTLNSQLRYPCLCLCLDTSQTTLTTPARLIILHLTHLFLTLD